MINNLEQTVLEKFRQLSQEKQADVLQFLDLIEQDISTKPTDAELKLAKDILSRAKQRAVSISPQSAQQLWAKFNQVKMEIATDFENK
jgi:hypothetical protein